MLYCLQRPRGKRPRPSRGMRVQEVGRVVQRRCAQFLARSGRLSPRSSRSHPRLIYHRNARGANQKTRWRGEIFRGSESGELNEAELSPDLGEGGERLVEIVPGVRGGDLATHAGLPLRHYRVTEAGHEDPFGQEQVAHPDGGRGLPEDDGNDRSLTGERLEAQLEEAIAEVVGLLAKAGSGRRRIRTRRVRSISAWRCADALPSEEPSVDRPATRS